MSIKDFKPVERVIFVDFCEPKNKQGPASSRLQKSPRRKLF